MNNIIFDSFDDEHRLFWERPDNYALVKGELNGRAYYTILTLYPSLFILMHDDDDYAVRLSDKMIENGVRVFDNMEAFTAWFSIPK